MQKKAEELAREHKEASISEFFEKNRHLLGYDNKIKALLIIVKEAVDNSLDATEEARILPDIYVKLEELGKEKYRVVIKDNGPGIVKKQIPKIFGTLLYGSKFHRLRQNRGAQGLGISCAVLYSQLTTGEPVEILSSTGDGKTHRYRLKIDVKKNTPQIIDEDELSGREWHGVQIAFACEGIYREHKQSVLEYIKQTAISNPFANMVFDSPTGRFEFRRSVEELPKEPKEIKPHIIGVEVGLFARMLHSTKARTLVSFLTTEFTRLGKTTAEEICKIAEVEPKTGPKRVDDKDVVKIIDAVKQVKLINPPTDCLSPLGESLIESGLKKELDPEFVAVVSRSPTVYRGWPFQIEAGIAYGGSITGPKLMRFANTVPLLYQQGDCAITKSATGIDWKRYKIESEKLPTGPVVIFIHMASVWVPFTSESKEAVASYPVIIKEIKLALQEVTRKLSIHLSKKMRGIVAQKRREMFKTYAAEIAAALSKLTGEKEEKIREKMLEIAEGMYEGLGLGEEIPEENGEQEADKTEDVDEEKESFKEGGEYE